MKISLEAAFDDCMTVLSHQVEKFPWDNEKIYAEWLAQTYFYVRHVTSLISLSTARIGPNNRQAQREQVKHLHEEESHDLLLIQDLAAIGKEISQFSEMPETSSFYQTQYYYIEHESPLAFFGSLLCLEGLAAASDHLNSRLEKAYGKEASQFVWHHVVIDKTHAKEGLNQIKALPQNEQEIIIRNLKQSTQLYSLMLSAIEKKWSKQIQIQTKRAA